MSIDQKIFEHFLKKEFDYINKATNHFFFDYVPKLNESSAGLI